MHTLSAGIIVCVCLCFLEFIFKNFFCGEGREFMSSAPFYPGVFSPGECLTQYKNSFIHSLYCRSQPTNQQIYQSFPVISAIQMHTQGQVAALTCLCLKTSLKAVQQEALIYMMTDADCNWPVAFLHHACVVLYFVNTTDESIMTTL